MIEKITRISTEDPIKYVWKTLRYFIDINFSIEQIKKIHNIEKKSEDNNIKKQAKQLGYCIRQAEEYFRASSCVNLPTRPLLLYYGIVNLSQALVLLRQNGDYSLDALRKKDTHKHHGLEILGDFKSSTYSKNDLKPFLNSIQCRCYFKNDIPWGQFPNFYKSIEPCVSTINTKYYNNNVEYQMVLNPVVTSDKIEIEKFNKKVFNVFNIIKTLPDLYNLLYNNSIIPDLCRGQANANHKKQYIKDANGQDVIKILLEFYYSIDFATPEQKSLLISYYKEYVKNIDITGEYENSFTFKQLLENPEIDTTFYTPDITENIFGDLYYIVYPNEYLPEPAAHFVILYCLGMISRYYPDIWLKTIDENVILAEVIDNLLDIVYRKFPYLILDQMTGIHHYCQH